jgi:kynurenine formamidase
MLGSMKVVDLTLTLGPDTVMWPGSPQPTAEAVLTIARDGFYNRLVSFVEHSSTHFDAPCHMVEGQASVDKVDPARLIAPVAMIDISADIAGDPDGVLTLDMLNAWEAKHGRVPQGAAVFLRTGWEDRISDPVLYMNAGGPLRFPGFGLEASKVLVDERGVVGLGVDTLGIDPGCDPDFVVHRQASLVKGVWHLENLTNLRSLPPQGAWAFVGVIKLENGSGGPARVLALVP